MVNVFLQLLYSAGPTFYGVVGNFKQCVNYKLCIKIVYYYKKLSADCYQYLDAIFKQSPKLAYVIIDVRLTRLS